MRTFKSVFIMYKRSAILRRQCNLLTLVVTKFSFYIHINSDPMRLQ